MKDIDIDPEGLTKGGGSLQKLGGELESGGSKLEQAGQSLQNRATQAAYLPGSTFKVVTAIAAIDSGRYTPDSVLSGASPSRLRSRPWSPSWSRSPLLLRRRTCWRSPRCPSLRNLERRPPTG